MKLIGMIALGVIIAGILGFMALAQKSKSGAPPGLVNGALSPLSVLAQLRIERTGNAGQPRRRAIAFGCVGRLPRLIEEKGDRVVVLRNDYIGAVFSTPLMGFVDDVEFRLADDAVHVRSASRVGYGDMGVNRKRVEDFRAALKE